MDGEQTARRMYAALGAADVSTITQLLDPAFVGVMTDGLPFGIGGTYRGPRAMLENCWGQVAKHYASWPEPAEFLPLTDGRLLVLGSYRGTARLSGTPLDAAFAHILRIEEGRIVEWRQVTDSAAWLAALQPQ